MRIIFQNARDWEMRRAKFGTIETEGDRKFSRTMRWSVRDSKCRKGILEGSERTLSS